MDNNKIIEKIINNIELSELINDPFDHKFVTNVLPADFFKEILLNLPARTEYPNLFESGRVGKDYSKERYLLNLNDQNIIQNFSDEKKLFIKKLITIFTSSKIFESVSKQFFMILKNRFQNFSEEEKNLYGKNNFKI